MKMKKLLALFCCGALALSAFAGCGSEGTDSGDGGDSKQEADANDPTKPAGYYQYSYEVEGLGTWVNYIHLYEESSIGQVFYAGYASNQITFAGTYEIEKTPCDYSVAMDRKQSEAGEKTDGTADYTITFTAFDGTDLGSCGYDGEYIYNDTTGVAGTGAENCAFQRDPEGLDGKYGQADSGYQGEVGVAYLEAVSPDDETCTVKLNHNGTYEDMIDVLVEGTWTMGEDGKTYTLTPDSDSDTGATLVVSDDGSSATYTPDGGTAVTLTIDTSKPVAVVFETVIPADQNGIGQDVDCWINCYNDNTCELYISAYGVELALDQGTYETNDDASIAFQFDTMGTVTSVNTDGTNTVDISFAGAPGVGDINTTLTQGAVE